jgi:uncharacterized protein (TIGR03435 family)
MSRHASVRRPISELDVRMRAVFGSLLVVLTVSAVSAQMIMPRADGSLPDPPGPGAPAFEVASVKPAAPVREDVPPMSLEPFRINGMPLRQIISQAYGLRPYQLVAAPDWIDEARFDIAARRPDGSDPRQTPAMLRQLLAERFKLLVTISTRELPIYELVRARADGALTSRLTSTTDDCEAIYAERLAKAKAAGDETLAYRFAAPGERVVCNQRIEMKIVDGAMVQTYTGGGSPFDTVLSIIRSAANRWVVDRTGLTGQFDFEIRFSPAEAPEFQARIAALGGGRSGEPTLASAVPIELAVQELGLKLQPARGPLPVLRIERVERPAPD